MAAPLLKSGAVAENGVKNGLLSFFSSRRALFEENESLKARLEEVEAKLLERDRLLAENLELKSLLGRSERGRTLLAAVIAKPGQSPYDMLILDVGENHDVTVGQKVLAYGSVIIGEIRQVSATVSKVALFTSPGEEYAGIISGKNISLKLVGRGGGNFMAELPRGVEVVKGEQVISTGLWPHLLGVVESVFVDPRDPFQKIILKSPVNAAVLNSVEIIL